MAKKDGTTSRKWKMYVILRPVCCPQIVTYENQFRPIGTAWCEQRIEVRSEELGNTKTERAVAYVYQHP